MKKWNLGVMIIFIMTICALLLIKFVDYSFDTQEQKVVSAESDFGAALMDENGEIYMGSIELKSNMRAPYPSSITYKQATEYIREILLTLKVRIGIEPEETYVSYSQAKDTYDIYLGVTKWDERSNNGSANDELLYRQPLEYAYFAKINMYNKDIYVLVATTTEKTEKLEAYKDYVAMQRVQSYCTAFIQNIGLGEIEDIYTSGAHAGGATTQVDCEILTQAGAHYVMSVTYPQMQLLRFEKMDTPFEPMEENQP